nr:uncharacterized protein LOC109167609 [Ipomoea batatas]
MAMNYDAGVVQAPLDSYLQQKPYQFSCFLETETSKLPFLYTDSIFQRFEFSLLPSKQFRFLLLPSFNCGIFGGLYWVELRDIFDFSAGLEAPRNSLDLPVEFYDLVFDCTYHMTNGWSDKNSYTTELPIKKLINEEIGRRPNKGRNAPSVVARLMGVDTLPLDSKPAARQNKKNNETKISNTFKEDEDVREVPIDRVTLTTNSSRHKKLSSFDGYEYCDQDRWSDSSMKLEKPKPREHPQEEELQKFKKEFEAWQTARFRECSKVVELDIPQSQWLAQQNLTREKMALYAKSTRGIVKEKPTELKAYKMDTDPQERSSLQHQKNRKENYADEQNNSFFLKSINSKTEFKENQKFEKVSAPTKIVILRPGFDDFDTKGASWASSPGISEDRGSMEDFLEEVKERLRREMQGKSSKRSTIARGGGIETPYSEKSPDARQLAQRIAKQVRESVTRDLGVNLPRSESTRSYRSEIQFDGTGSPEFINRDTRRFLTERLRNVLKEETCRDIPRAVHGCSRLGLLSKEKMRTEESSGTRNAGSKFSHWDEMKNKSDMQSSSFRKDNDDDDDDDVKLEAELSPRNLIRSLSAPVSGTSFGKLLLEDRHILTGAHIRRKHEAIEKVTLNAKKRRKEKFNLKEKVSSFKYSFMLRGKLFGKKLPSLEESHGNKLQSKWDLLIASGLYDGSSDKYLSRWDPLGKPISNHVFEEVILSISSVHCGPSLELLPTASPSPSSIRTTIDIVGRSSVLVQVTVYNCTELFLSLQLLDLHDDIDVPKTSVFSDDFPVDKYLASLKVIEGLFPGNYVSELGQAGLPPCGPLPARVYKRIECSNICLRGVSNWEKIIVSSIARSQHHTYFDLSNSIEDKQQEARETEQYRTLK